MRTGVKILALGAFMALVVAGALVRPSPAAPPNGAEDPLLAYIGQCIDLSLSTGVSEGEFQVTLTDVSEKFLGTEWQLNGQLVRVLVSRTTIIFVTSCDNVNAAARTSSSGVDNLLSRLSGSGSQ